ncbi:YceK/YidQ family lipoprotein [Dasania marina]|uniref:YceK/YidQ family lipoprotein n=1 Tax=Dasania marina TaxID=471499 RepID=UPI0030DC941B|tara:strand:- start:101193 stop:101507 length:315 start_codon:yes stop_codon:yes gene_type:complete
MKLIISILLFSVLCGCGTLNTLSNSDEQIAINLKKQKTNCESIPRAYSGVSYDFCKLNSNPNTIYNDWFLGFYLVDGVVSVVADTIVLPYTIFQQVDKGNLEFN